MDASASATAPEGRRRRLWLGRRAVVTRRPPQAALGLQRVLGVRVVLTENGAVGEAIGVLRRRPVVQRISLARAAALVAQGVPLAVRRPEEGAAGSEAPEGSDAIPGGR